MHVDFPLSDLSVETDEISSTLSPTNNNTATNKRTNIRRRRARGKTMQQEQKQLSPSELFRTLSPENSDVNNHSTPVLDKSSSFKENTTPCSIPATCDSPTEANVKTLKQSLTSSSDSLPIVNGGSPESSFNHTGDSK